MKRLIVLRTDGKWMAGKAIKYFDPIEYKGFYIHPFTTRKCSKRDYIIFNSPTPDGEKLHGGQFNYFGQAKLYIDQKLLKESGE